VAGLSGALALVLLLPMEAGVPIPVPADLVMFQVHLVLGLLLGPLADRAFDQAKGPALAAAAVLVVAVVVFWRVRRRRRAAAPGAWMEASCPACIGVTLLAGRVSGLAGLAAPDPVRTEPGDSRKVLVS
jgi:sugar phosphate permease